MKSSMIRSTNTAAGSQPECVKVVVRCRPLLAKEKEEGYAPVVDVNCERGTVQLQRSAVGTTSSSLTSSTLSASGTATTTTTSSSNENVKIYTFDSVYDCNSTQEDIYAEIFHPLVDSVLEGFNGTIFAYGQTGTGKTFTMEGDAQHPGVISRSFAHIFSHIARSNDKQFLVRSSYLEIYQEEIRDLLASDPNKRLELRERPEVGVYVKDLSSFVCKNVVEIEKVLAKGQHNRSVGSTNMNEHSSRSHAIFIITIEHTERDQLGNEHIRVGRLNLVDLAGSERQMKTKTVGQRQKEAIKINLSLSALGNVISALVDGRSTHIPYRDSKLTRLLQDSLGGNARTVMVANIGPAEYNYEETLITLRYANRAKNIKNRPHVNEDPKDTLLKEFQAEIERLREQLERKRKLRASPGGGGGGMSPATTEEEIDVEATEKLTSRIKAMESKMLVGGKNIVDHTNEQQRQLEQRQTELRERRTKERTMLRQLEEQEEATQEVRETFTSLQQEVELKRRKLRKVVKEFQSVNSEINDLHETYGEERRELERISDELMHDLKLRYLVIDNFIPEYEKTRFLKSVYYDENDEEWHYRPTSNQSTSSASGDTIPSTSRPGTASSLHSRPNSYCDPRRLSALSSTAVAANNSEHLSKLLLGFHVPFRVGKIDGLGLYMPERTTRDYEVVLDASEDVDDDGVRIEIVEMNASPSNMSRMKSVSSLRRKQPRQSGSNAWNNGETMVGKTPPPMRRSLTVMSHYNEDFDDWQHSTVEGDIDATLDAGDINSVLDQKRANVRRNLFLATQKDKENLNRRPDTAFPKCRGLVPK